LGAEATPEPDRGPAVALKVGQVSLSVPPVLRGSTALRFALLPTLLMLLVGSLAAKRGVCASTTPSAPATATTGFELPAATPAWVRTTGGWEQPTAWRAKQRFKPDLHPAVVAGFVALAGVAVLLGWPPRGSLEKKNTWRQKTLF